MPDKNSGPRTGSPRTDTRYAQTAFCIVGSSENKPVPFEESKIFDELEAFCIRSFSLNLFELETSKSSDPNRLPLIPFSFIGVVGGPMLTGREFCDEAGDRGGLRII